jgi:hypothetical protein
MLHVPTAVSTSKELTSYTSGSIVHISVCLTTVNPTHFPQMAKVNDPDIQNIMEI